MQRIFDYFTLRLILKEVYYRSSHLLFNECIPAGQRDRSVCSLSDSLLLTVVREAGTFSLDWCVPAVQLWKSYFHWKTDWQHFIMPLPLKKKIVRCHGIPIFIFSKRFKSDDESFSCKHYWVVLKGASDPQNNCQPLCRTFRGGPKYLLPHPPPPSACFPSSEQLGWYIPHKPYSFLIEIVQFNFLYTYKSCVIILTQLLTRAV